MGNGIAAVTLSTGEVVYPDSKENCRKIVGDSSYPDCCNYAQNAKIRSFLNEEEIDQIRYDTGNSHSDAFNDGRDKIGDAKKADEHGGQAGNAAVTSVGTAGGAFGVMVLAKVSAKIITNTIPGGFIALGMGIATAAAALISLAFARAFDNGYDDRTKANDNAGGTNETMDNTTNALAETMDAMNEDMDLYKEQQDSMTNMLNNNVSAKADLQAQLIDAQAAGDTNRVKQLKEQIKGINGVDLSKQQEEIDETREHLEEYKLCNDEALGVKDGGQTVSDFLKEGTPLGVVAALDAALIAVATIMSASALKKSIMAGASNSAKGPWAWAAAAAAYVGAAAFVVAGTLLAASGYTMGEKSKKEFECGSSGRDMEGHVSTLNDMITQQEGYVESTGENFDETDEGAEESRSKAEGSAAETVGNAKDRVAAGGGKKDDDNDKDKDKDKDKK